MTRQNQRAGSGGTQIQIGTYNVIGLTEERAREISRETAEEVWREYSREAVELADQRLEEFSEKLISRLSNSQRLDRVADPAFQVLLRKAQLSAGATGDESDYDVLVELLAEDSLDTDRVVRAVVSKAIAVVDLVDKGALNALTLSMILMNFSPATDKPDACWRLMDDWVAPFADGELPQGRGWLDHLDVLEAVSIIQADVATLQPFRQIWATRRPAVPFADDVLERHTHLAKAVAWWDGINPAFTMRSIGIALAHARIDSKLRISNLPALSHYLGH